MDLKITYRKEEFGFDEPLQKEGVKPLSYVGFQDYESFYAEVYRQMFQSLFAYGMQICGNRSLVKDCIQELFSELWENQKTLTKVKSVKPYLLKCTKRKIKRALGKGKRLTVASSFEIEVSHEVRLINDQQYIKNQHLLNTALKSLTTRQREAIYLRFYDNLSYDEVAEVLKITTKATYKLVSRALITLKETMTTHS